jgi:hypothetical protein
MEDELSDDIFTAHDETSGPAEDTLIPEEIEQEEEERAAVPVSTTLRLFPQKNGESVRESALHGGSTASFAYSPAVGRWIGL